MKSIDLDVDEVADERPEDHLVAVPTLAGVGLDAALQLPPLAAVAHEDLRVSRTAPSQTRGSEIRSEEKLNAATQRQSNSVLYSNAVLKI